MNTGSRAFCFLIALAATGSEVASAAVVAPAPYRVEAKVVSLPAADSKDIATSYNGYYSDRAIAHLIDNPKASILSLPSVTAAYSSASDVEITKEMTLPGGKSRETGISLKVTPNRKADAADSFKVAFENVRFVGFSDQKASLPIFSMQGISTSLTMFHEIAPGYYCLNIPAPAPVPKAYDADGRVIASIADANERQLLFVKITRG